MENSLYPVATPETGKKREQLTPETLNAWRAFSRQVFADRVLPTKTKDLIAIAVAHVTRCPNCIRAHTKSVLAKGATEKEIMEAIWVAAEMRAGGAVAHSALAIDVMREHVRPSRMCFSERDRVFIGVRIRGTIPMSAEVNPDTSRLLDSCGSSMICRLASER